VHWIDDQPAMFHEDGRYEVIGRFAVPQGFVQAKVLASTSDSAEWRRIMEAIETIGSLNLDLDRLQPSSDGSLSYGIDLVGHRIEYLIEGGTVL